MGPIFGGWDAKFYLRISVGSGVVRVPKASNEGGNSRFVQVRHVLIFPQSLEISHV